MAPSHGLADLRWVDYSRRSMQRVGFLKWMLALTSSSRPQSLEALSRAFAKSVTSAAPLAVEAREKFKTYVKEQKLHQRYKEWGDTVELQDLFLSDPAVPSASGAMTGDIDQKGYRHSVYVDVPTWALKLQLLRPQNYTLTDRGRVFLMCGCGEAPSAADDPNPFLLNTSEQYTALYCLLEADGDFIRHLYEPLVQQKTFSRTEAGAGALEALTKLKGQAPAGGRQAQLRSRIERAIAAVRNQKGQGMGPRESIATPRTEPLVDCGVLERLSAGEYEYRITEGGMQFFEALFGFERSADFLASGFSAAAMPLFGGRAAKGEPELNLIVPAYEELRSGLGYVSMRELALLTAARALGAGGPVFEISGLEEALRNGSAKRHVRMAVARLGKNSQVKIDVKAVRAGGAAGN